MNELKEEIQSLFKKIEILERGFKLEEKKERLRELEKKIQQSDFWQKEKNPAQLQQEFSDLKENIEKLKRIKKEVEELNELASLMKDESAEVSEFEVKIQALKKEIKNLQQEIFLSGKYDKHPAILTIEAGAGGRDAEDWAALLKRMYERYCQRKGFACRILHQSLSEGGGPEGRIGVKEVTMEIKGRLAYGLLKKETGVHRLVRISPFSAKSLRHTSFAKVEVIPEIKDNTETDIKLNPEELKIETFRASGPGGQYVNRRESAVRITHLPTGLKAESQSERLQGLNRKMAEKVLISKLIALQEKKREEEIQKLKGDKKIEAEFGNQIRSYVFHPYKLVKDHRTGVETSEVEEVLDGNLDRFIEAEITF